MCKSFKTFLAIMFFSIWLIPNSFVSAAENKIESIDIDIELQENGSAEIHEYREMDNKEDSEIFIELSNLGASELTGFEVDGFEEVKDWDIDASIDEKANRYSVIEKDDGYELVWGIGEYGLNTYDLTYGLTGLVRNLEDGQTLFWNFDSFLSFPTDQMNLTIRTDFDLKEKLLDYYAFGFEGPIDINEEGVLEWTGESLDESNDITILLQFPENTFQTDIKEDMTLDEQKEMALEGSSYNESEPMSTGIKIFIGMIVVLGTAFGVTGIAYLVKTNKIKKENDHFDIYQFIKKNKNKVSKEVPYLKGSYENYAWLISRLSIGGAGFSEYFFLYLLHWSKQGKIKIDSYNENGFFGDKKKAKIEITNFKAEEEVNILDLEEYIELYGLQESQFDEVIWGMLIELADENGKIKGKDIEKWAQKNAESIQEIIELLEEHSKDWLEKNDYLNVFTVNNWFREVEIEQLTNSGEELAEEINAYRNFIQKLKEVKLDQNEDWEKFMLWSVLFGLADDAVKELKELDPSRFAYLEENYPYYYGNYHSYHYLYTRSTHGLASAGYSGAGGEFSSAGGGAGAGGGGGGGSR